jgi:hypothetical protein
VPADSCDRDAWGGAVDGAVLQGQELDGVDGSIQGIDCGDLYNNQDESANDEDDLVVRQLMFYLDDTREQAEKRSTPVFVVSGKRDEADTIGMFAGVPKG